MSGKRFVTGDRQTACLFEQRGSYTASIKETNGRFRTLQLGTNRNVAFERFFDAAANAGYNMRSVAEEQGADPNPKLNREQRRRLEKENRHAKNREQNEEKPKSEKSGRKPSRQPSVLQASEALCELEHGCVTRHPTSHGKFLFTYDPTDGSDQVVKSVSGRISEIVDSFKEWYKEQDKAHMNPPTCPAKVSCRLEDNPVIPESKKEKPIMSVKDHNDTASKIASTDETVFSIMANGPETSKPIMAFRSKEDAAYFQECLEQAAGVMGGDTTYSIVDLILKN